MIKYQLSTRLRRKSFINYNFTMLRFLHILLKPYCIFNEPLFGWLETPCCKLANFLATSYI